MSFRINTNVNALMAHAQSTFSSNSIQDSLSKLSSGLRINKAADDASGMAIADSLRSQGNSLYQAIRNANDGIGIIQVADKAMDEQIKILDTIKTKATQAAQDGQTTETRKAIQADVNRLLESLDNIASTTSFNGQQLLSGQFTNKQFQVGAYSNTTVKASIGATSSDKVGNVRMETSAMMQVSAGASTLKNVTLKFMAVDGKTDVTLESVNISTSAGTGIGVLSEVINKNSNSLGVTSSWVVQATGTNAIQSGSVQGLTINGVTIGTISGVQANDADGRLVAAINTAKDRTGVEASLDEQGRLNLKSGDGRAIQMTTTSAAATMLGGGDFSTISASSSNGITIVGRMTLGRLNARDIEISGTNIDSVGLSASTASNNVGMSQQTINLRSVRGNFSSDVACAAGANMNAAIATDNYDADGIGAGVTSLKGAMMVMDIADSAMRQLDSIRSDLGSAQNQLTSTINNITITQVNVKSAESTIREVDFASESAEFSKNSILMQSGSYALGQANVVQQNVLMLLSS